MGAAVPLIAVAATVASTAVSAIGAIRQGNALSSMANYQAQVSRNNAIIAGRAAEQATQTGELQAFEEGLRQRQQQQAITSGIAAGGMDVNTGSSKDVRESARELGVLDVETVRQRAALAAYGYRTQQTSFEAQSRLESAQAGFEQSAGWLKGTGALLTGAAALGGGLGGDAGFVAPYPGSGQGLGPGPGTGGLY